MVGQALKPAGNLVDTYIVQIYRRDAGAKALTGRIEHVGNGTALSLSSAEGLWKFLLRVPDGGGARKRTRVARRSRTKRAP
jgi:hypothetical protein